MLILIVDDDPEIRSVLSEYVSALGHDVIAAGSGREAIVALTAAESPVDAALVDWQMAGISGRDVLMHLIEHYPDTVPFVSTGYDASVISDEHLSRFVAGIFRKPFSMKAMLKEVTRAVAEHAEP
ncbi:MAG: response regulator [Proteobacteria bacterium]|nr:response regulator [Pseudomonadota bacterium]MCP4918877.1 response regulator [Pseudomonadota bacterium]